MAEPKERTVSKNSNQRQRMERVSKVLGEVKTEGTIDFAKFADDYTMIRVPIICGSSMGDIYIFSHKEDQIHEDFIKLYRAKLCNQINTKKHIMSEKAGGDVGPVVAVASFIEEGDYDKFLVLFNEYLTHEIHKNMREEGEFNQLLETLDKPITEKILNQTLENIAKAMEERKLKSLEHVFLVHDHNSGKFYHMMPSDPKVKMTYENLEQAGLIQASIYRSIKDKLYEFSDDTLEENCRKAIETWVSADDRKNPKLSRKILEESEIKKLEVDVPEADKNKKPKSIVYNYEHCLIFEDVFDKMRKTLCPI